MAAQPSLRNFDSLLHTQINPSYPPSHSTFVMANPIPIPSIPQSPTTDELGPICKLDQDILWLIFNICTDESFASSVAPVTTLRYSSQVCQNWRNVILQSSSLWGRVIDLDFLGGKKEDWRDEVMRRTGASLLWVQGCVTSATGAFFFSLLSKHWVRIQKLSVYVMKAASLDTAPNWSTLQLPSPNLEEITIDLQHRKNLDLPPHLPLFANNAPSLRLFAIPDVTFHLHSPWLFNLRGMTFDITLTVAEIFEALKGMHLLEALVIDFPIMTQRRFSEVETSNVFPKIDLLHLKDLQLRGFDDECLPFLEHITPAPGCSLSIAAESNSIDPLQMNRHLARFSRNYFHHHTTECISIRYTPRDLHFEEHTVNWERRPFAIKLFLISAPMPTLIFTDFANSPYFSHLKILKIELIDILDVEFSLILIKFIFSLKTITMLQANTDTIDFLLKGYPEFFPFPALHTLKILNTLAFTRFGPPPPLTDVLLPFLSRQRDAGSSVSVLDLSEIPFLHLPDMEFLEDLTGLRVKWDGAHGKTDYECGSGRPQDLRFKYHSLNHKY